MQNLKNESDQVQRDFEFLYYLVKNPRISIVDIDTMYATIQKYSIFTTDFCITRKIPIPVN